MSEEKKQKETLNWEEKLVKKIVTNYAELGAVPNMVAILMRNHKTALLPLPAPEMQTMVRQEVQSRKADIEEIALIANAYETELTEEQFKNRVDTEGLPKNESVIIMFETRKGMEIRRFKVKDKKLVEMESSRGNNVSAFSFGLYESRIDSGMYR